MTDYRSLYDREYLAVWDLQGRDFTLKIARVVGATLTAQGNRKSKKPVIYFEKASKGFAINKTIGKTIAGMYGTNIDDWVGKLITLYPTETQFGSETVPCIRVRPKIPRGKSESLEAQPVDVAVAEQQQRAANLSASEQREPGSDDE